MSTRRLAAILATDVVGYSAMIGCDELGTLARVRGLRSSVIEPPSWPCKDLFGYVST
jgi:class 3 adenylate cyclase